MEMGRCMRESVLNKLKKVLFFGSILIVLFAVFILYGNYWFNHGGLKDPLISRTEEMRQEWMSSELVCQFENSHRLAVSKVYLIESGDGIQIRFRVAYTAFLDRRDLFRDISCTIVDSDGNHYESTLIMFPQKIIGVEMVCATISMNQEQFSLLSEKELTINIKCTEYGENDDYAYGKLVIKISE